MSHYAVVDPVTGKTVKEYPTISDSALSEVIGRSYEAHSLWSATPVGERAAVMTRAAELHDARRDELARIIVREMGKPLRHALDEIDYSVMIYDFFGKNAETLLADEPITLISGEGSAYIRRNSLGVLLGIMPWNYPNAQVARFAAPNLVAGNTIVLKHAPQCPESSAALEQLLLDAGLPDGVYLNVYASNDQVETVIADPRVRGVSLTGSERAGSAVAEIAGRHLKKLLLELGGSDPFILLASDNLDTTVEAAVAARLENNGQACNSGKRFVVIDSLYESFLEKFTAALTAVTPRDPYAEEAAIGPLSSTAAADRLEDQLQRAIAQGATLVSGGARQGNFFSPAVLTGITPANDAYREEFFGPVAAVYRVGSEDEAIRLANDTSFGLGSYVYTPDLEQAQHVADKLEVGMVFINTVAGEGPELPFGGVKRSGFGRELGRFGIDEFVNKKLVRIGA